MLALDVDDLLGLVGHRPDSGDLDSSAAHLVEASHYLDFQCGPRTVTNYCIISEYIQLSHHGTIS